MITVIGPMKKIEYDQAIRLLQEILNGYQMQHQLETPFQTLPPKMK
jgi:hypothetical protein